MIANKTTLIVGSGASVALEYPTGAQLREWIIGGNWISHDLSEGTKRMQQQLSWRLRLSLIPSIDAFLAEDANVDLRDWGIVCIAGALLPCEARKKEHPPEWLRLVFNAIRGKKSAERAHRLKIVTFNYDLSIEYFLFHAFRGAFKLDMSQAKAQLDESVEIIHVYGQLGQISELGGDREYGSEDYERDITKASKGLKIIGRAPDDEMFKRAHEVIREAEFLAILGFGYDETNVANLKLVELAKDKHLFSTGWEMGYGMRGWVQHMGLENALIGAMKDDVPAFLQKSAFLHWANTPGKTGTEMATSIRNFLLEQGRLPY